MTKKPVKTAVQEETFDPPVTVNFKVPFSVRTQLKKRASDQGKTLDEFMKDLINHALTTK